MFDEPILPVRLAAYLAEPGHQLVVAVAGGQIVGQCAAVIHRHPDKVAELFIDEVGTAPAQRRRGIAWAMITEMVAWGREQGCGEIWVGTEPDNGPARQLYSTLGLHQQPVIIYEGDI